MTSNQTYSAMIADTLEELSQEGITHLCPALEKLFNELMKIEREQVLGAAPYERSDQRKEYANGFKNKMVQTRLGKLQSPDGDWTTWSTTTSSPRQKRWLSFYKCNTPQVCKKDAQYRGSHTHSVFKGRLMSKAT